MTAIRLTSADPGNPPEIINPDHVTRVTPRKAMRPDLASQHQHFQMAYEGAKLHLVTGQTVNVIEDHDVVEDRLWPRSALWSDPTTMQTGTIPQSQIAGLNLRDEAQEQAFVDSLKDAGAPVSDANIQVDVPSEKPVAKKAPAKKAAPPAGGKAEEEDVD